MVQRVSRTDVREILGGTKTGKGGPLFGGVGELSRKNKYATWEGFAGKEEMSGLHHSGDLA